MDSERTRSTNIESFPAKPTRPRLTARPSLRRPLHILATRLLDGDDVLVEYSDGSAAIFHADELEKLRPVPKQVLRDVRMSATRAEYTGSPA